LLLGEKRVGVLAEERMEEGGGEDEEMDVIDVPCCSGCLSWRKKKMTMM
jgi:uncharacterized protein YaiE (UPF0345 family)